MAVRSTASRGKQLRSVRTRNPPATARGRIISARPTAPPPRTAPVHVAPSQELRIHDFGRISTTEVIAKHPPAARTAFGSTQPRCTSVVTTSSTGLMCHTAEKAPSTQPVVAVVHEPQRISIHEMQKRSLASGVRLTVAETIARGGAAPQPEVCMPVRPPATAAAPIFNGRVRTGTTPRGAAEGGMERPRTSPQAALPQYESRQPSSGRVAPAHPSRPTQPSKPAQPSQQIRTHDFGKVSLVSTPQPAVEPPPQRRVSPASHQTPAMASHAAREVSWAAPTNRPQNAPNPGQRAAVFGAPRQATTAGASALGIKLPPPQPPAPCSRPQQSRGHADAAAAPLPSSSPYYQAGAASQNASAQSSQPKQQQMTVATARTGGPRKPGRKVLNAMDPTFDLLQALGSKYGGPGGAADPASTLSSSDHGSAWIETAATEATRWMMRNKYGTLDAIIESRESRRGIF